MATRKTTARRPRLTEQGGASTPHPRERAVLPARATLGSDYKRQKHLRRQREILDAAAATFTEFGFHATTMRSIAQRVGTRAGSLYHYIASKEVALESICRATGAETNRRLTNILLDGSTVADMVQRGIEMHLNPASLDYVHAFAFFRRNLPANAKTEMNLLAKQYLTTWEAILRQGVADGSMRGNLDSRTAAMGIVAMCNGVISWLVRKTPGEITLVSRELASLVLSGLLMRPANARSAVRGRPFLIE